jgi:hypothetical protein
MKFNKASEVEQVCYEFKLADFPRGLNRAKINDLFNGVPPYSGEEVESNNIAINVNFLGGTRLSHEARMQFSGNFLKPGRFFTCRTDAGPKHKRSGRSAIVTKEIAKIMKASSVYYEAFRSKFALDVLHGIGPSAWDKPDFWCPDAMGIEDILIPANTLLTMKNLPFFSVYRSYTGPELARLTRNEEISKKAGWNMDMVQKCLEYIDSESTALMGNNWPEVWSPEKMTERVKGDGGFYSGDQVPTIDCFDFYFWDDDENTEGWKRRIVLDSWATPQGVGGGKFNMGWNSKVDFAKNQFLFTSKNRKVASKWSELVAFQFADLSAVAPFRYHSVRGMGWLLYAVIHLQNRMRCKFNEAIFEALMMYFRVKSMDEAERALKVELFNRGFIDETLQFIPASERFQVNSNLVELGLGDLEKTINEHSSSWTQNNQQGQSKAEKTKFEVMAEIQKVTSMISAGLQQAYRYQEFEYREIFRRFCKKDSRDPDINLFRARCMSQGVPESMLIPESWDIEPERVLGAGNKTLEMAIAEQLMQYRNLYDPEPQRAILRDFTLAITDDPGRTESMVPEEPNHVTDSVHDAQLAAGSLMMGLPVAMKTGISHIEYVDAMLVSFQVAIGRIQKRGGVPTQEELEGLSAVYEHLTQHIKLVAQDENEKERVTNWEKQITRLMNLVKAFAQRLQEQQKAQGQQQGGQASEEQAKSQAKIEAMKQQSEAKAANTRDAHAQRTAQRQLQWEMEQHRKDVELQNELKRENARLQLELRKEQHKNALELGAKQVEHGMDLGHKQVEHDMAVKAEKKKQSMKSTSEDKS